jgi:hypothetical protein
VLLLAAGFRKVDRTVRQKSQTQSQSLPAEAQVLAPSNDSSWQFGSTTRDLFEPAQTSGGLETAMTNVHAEIGKTEHQTASRLFEILADPDLPVVCGFAAVGLFLTVCLSRVLPIEALNNVLALAN